MKYIKFSTIITALVLVLGLAHVASAAVLTRQLELGMRGNDVSDLQTFLAQDPAIYPQGLITGYFGPLTRTAVSNFQRQNGIKTVGRVGPITLAEINAQIGNGYKVGTDRRSPTIGSIDIKTMSMAATISWSTDEGAAAIVYYSTSPLDMREAGPNTPVYIGGSSFLVHTDIRQNHVATLTGLQSNATYYYVLYVRDESGNESVTWPGTFRTTN